MKTDVEIRGVYSTIHLDTGDLDTNEVRGITVDGATVTYLLTRRHIPRGGTFEWTTLHIGPLVKRQRLTSPQTVRRDDDVTVVQPVEIVDFI